MKISKNSLKILKFFPIIGVVFFSFLFQISNKNLTLAQNACTVTGVTFSPSGNQASGWFTSTNPPQVSVTVNTTGDCANKTLQLEIQDYKTISQPDEILISSDYTFKAGESSHIFEYKSGDNCIDDIDQYSGRCVVFAKTKQKVALGAPLSSMVFSTENNGLNSVGKLAYPVQDRTSSWIFISPPPPPPAGGDPAEGGNGPVDSSLPKLQNPLCAEGSTKCIESIPDFIKVALDIIILIAVPAVALAIMYAGFLMVMGAATGNTEKIKQGKNAFLYAIIGGAILLGAWVIANAIGDTVNSLSS